MWATTLVSVTGDQSAYQSGDIGTWLAQSWTQADSYTDVTISATVFQLTLGTPHGQGFAYLEKKVGNHAVELDSTTFHYPADSGQSDPAVLKLFKNLSLGPATYYLAMYGDGFWTAEFLPVIEHAADVTGVTDSLYSQDSGHTFPDTNNGIFQDFVVTGTEVVATDTPEPAFPALSIAAVVAILGIRKKGESHVETHQRIRKEYSIRGER